MTAALVGIVVSLSLEPIPSDSITIALALKLSTSMFATVLLSASIPLLVRVCEPANVATVLSMANVTPFPLAAEVNPVPPNNDNVSESRSIDIALLPSLMSKSSAVICVST